jgi:hypothetical protein
MLSVHESAVDAVPSQDTEHWVNGQKQGEAAMENSRRDMIGWRVCSGRNDFRA